MNKTILLDVDGVVADCATPVYEFAKTLFEDKELPPPEKWEHYEFEKAMGLNRNEADVFQVEIRRANNIGEQIKFYPEAQSFIEFLATDNQVVFVTTPWRGLTHWVEARYELLRPYAGRKNFGGVIFTEDKHHVSGDWLIDDKWSNMFQTPDRGILFARPWNVADHEKARCVCNTYASVIKRIEKREKVKK